MDTRVRHRPFGRIAYLRGRPASEWIEAISKHRRPRESTPLTHPRP